MIKRHSSWIDAQFIDIGGSSKGVRRWQLFDAKGRGEKSPGW